MENIKAKAWEFLIKYNLGDFPQDTLKVNTKNVGFKVASYHDGKIYIESLELTDYSQNHKGFAIDDGNTRIIFYDDNLAYSERNLVIAHEIGHIVLGHTSSNKVIGKSTDKKKENLQEKEADVFALAYLSPAPVLLEMNLHSPTEIARVTGIPLDFAQSVAIDVIKEKYTTKTGIEKNLLNVFRESIYKYAAYRIEPETPQNIVISPTYDNQKNIYGLMKLGLILISCLILSVTAIYITKSILSKNESNSPSSTIENHTTITALQSLSPVETTIVNNISTNTNTVDTANKAVSIDNVVVTKTGTKYHLPDCYHVKGKNNLTTLTMEAAKNRGYIPCKDCRPDNI